MSTQDSAAAGFGANEWMVEEMRDAWQADPSSVSPQWRALFEGSESPHHPESPESPEDAALEDPPTAPGSGSSPRRAPTAVQDVTRSDLPPAPPSDAAPPTSPYAQRRAHQHVNSPEGDTCQDANVRLKGAAARTAKNMEESLSIPTATSARTIPAKVLIENRAVINGHLRHTHGGKISFTHLIGWAVV